MVKRKRQISKKEAKLISTLESYIYTMILLITRILVLRNWLSKLTNIGTMVNTKSCKVLWLIC